MKKIFKHFFLKNFLMFFIPMFIPLLILGSLSVYVTQQYVKGNINEENMTLLHQTKENMDMILYELDTLNLYTVASATEFLNLKQMLEKEILNIEDHKKLASLKKFIDSPNIAKPYIYSIYVYVDNNRQKFLSSKTGGIIGLQDTPDHAWFKSFQQHKGKDDTWIESRWVRMDGVERVQLVTIYHKIPEYNGVIVLNISADYIKEQLANLSIHKGQGIIILNEQGKMIFNNGQKLPNSKEMLDITSHNEEHFSTKIDGIPYVISKMAANENNWTYITYSPKDVLYEVPSNLFGIVLILVLLSLISSASVAYIFTRSHVKNVKVITEIFEQNDEAAVMESLPSNVKDVYGYIVHNILKNFMEHNYLKGKMAEKKYKMQQMEFIALQAQLNPHFLYNTLETINWKAYAVSGKHTQLNDMIGNLADILRYSLDGDHEKVPFAEEIKYTNSYIEIQKIRYKDQFEIIWDVDPDIERFPVKKLILQPILENSIMHGIKNGEKCFIKIKMKVRTDRIHITIIDNGEGMSKHKLKEVRNKFTEVTDTSQHIGLINTYKRLIITYGERYALQINSKKNWGTVVTITIPK